MRLLIRTYTHQVKAREQWRVKLRPRLGERRPLKHFDSPMATGYGKSHNISDIYGGVLRKTRPEQPLHSDTRPSWNEEKR
ncbi:unnamed protein product [Diplocarpon coronariae]